MFTRRKLQRSVVFNQLAAPGCDFSDTLNPNQDIVDFLLELSDFERNVSRNVYKANAYKKAAGTIAHLTERISSGKEVSAKKQRIILHGSIFVEFSQ